MKISYNWLKQYINLNLKAEKLGEILTDIGLEVEGIEEYESIKGGLKGLIIGEVLTCEKHPNADKLSVTTVNVGGQEILPIVCGAPNVAAGQKVVVATVGTTLFSGDESFQIKKSKIRGEVSEGMICAEDEIGLGNSHDGILVLDENSVPGTPASEYFKIESDVIFEIGLTPNRADAMSHYGVARDLKAFFDQTDKVGLKKPEVESFKIESNNLPVEVVVENPEACTRYSGLTISNIRVEESPDWLKNSLKSIGLVPINNVVDITNFVLHEMGQPLHAFDATRISGNKVVVKTLEEGTTFTTLDEVERKLSENDLMICDAQRPMCIGGVFGGMESGVTESTTAIFLESACFNPVSIRKTAKYHGLNTDASFRFERGTDPNITIFALKRAASLISEIAGGNISSDIFDFYPEPAKPFEVSISFKNINTLTGIEFSKEEIRNILTSLEIQITNETEAGFDLEIPPYRVDVRREADVIEDILRIYGYDNIPVTNSVKSTIQHPEHPNRDKVQCLISDFLTSQGFSEMMNNSLTKVSYYEENEIHPLENCVKMLNPLSSDLGVMRQSLLYGALEVVARNFNYKQFDLKLYEFGNSYTFSDSKGDNPVDQYGEKKHLFLLKSGKSNEQHWKKTPEEIDFFDLKAYVENILRKLGIEIEVLKQNELKSKLYSSAYSFDYQGKTLVEFGFVHADLLNLFKIDKAVFVADFDWENLMSLHANAKTVFEEIPLFPEVSRDLALMVDKSVTYDSIKRIALKTEKKILKSVQLFDVYEGDQLKEGKKSYAVNFILQDRDNTLSEKAIKKTMNKLMGAFTHQLGAEIR